MAEDPKKEDPAKPDPVKVDPSEIEALKAQLAKANLDLEGYKSKDKTLHDKVTDDNKEKDKIKADSKALELALTFSLTSKDFIKNNESVLPKGISDIFVAAGKETYDSPIQKANAIKDGIIQSFFSQQSNVDMLTESQKSDLADFQKLTKNGREANSAEIYKNIFEPVLESVKRIKKAEELYRSKNGYRGDSEGDTQYKERLMSGAKKHFLGEKV